ncbi:MAG: hypothetical protein AB7G44_13585 [Bacteroidia bacterium]
MKKTFIGFVLLTTMLTSCVSVSEKFENTVVKTVEIIGASHYTITHTSYNDTRKGSSDEMVVTFDNPKENYSNDKAPSLVALTIIQSLNEDDCKKFDRIKIIVNSNSSTFEDTYVTDDLIKTNAGLLKLADFIDSASKYDTINLKKLCDNNFIADSTLLQMTKMIKAITDEYGKLNEFSINGFRYDSIKGSDKSVIETWVEAVNGEAITNYTFYISRDDLKIIYIGINDKHNGS